MFTKLNNKMRNMTWKAWLMTSLWFSTLIVLFAFVFTAALMEKGGKTDGKKIDHYSITVREDQFESSASGHAKLGSAKETKFKFPKISATDTSSTKVPEISNAQELYITQISNPTSKTVVDTVKDAAATKKVEVRLLTFNVKTTSTVPKTIKEFQDQFEKATFKVTINGKEILYTFKKGSGSKTTITTTSIDNFKAYATTLDKNMEQVADSDAKAYQNGLAGTAALFTVLIFGALGTTVGIKFYERKHSKGGAK